MARFRAILDEEGLPGPRGQNGRSLILRCPIDGCGSKLVVEKRSGRFVCWRCRYLNDMWGSAEKLLARMIGCSVEAARRRLYGDHVQMRALLPPVCFLDEDDTEEAILPLRAYEYHMLPIEAPGAERGAEYLAGRGIPVEVAKEYGIRYSSVLRQVIFPVVVDGGLVGWQGRLVIPHEWVDEHGTPCYAPKSPTLPGTPRDRFLMFQDRITGSHALLAEGPVSTIKAHLVGGNVASLGKAVAAGQLDTMRKKRIRRLYLGLDRDAVEEVARLVRRVGCEWEVFHVTPPPGYDDLGEMPIEAVPDRVAESPRVYGWQIFVDFGAGR